MRSTWILGNWKQNHLRGEATKTSSEIARGLDEARAGAANFEVGIAPSFLALDSVRAAGGPNLLLLSQDVAAQESGAFTGEVGSEMLREAGVSATLVGHSERRAKFGDGHDQVRAKLQAALAGGLKVILCVGEQLEDRQAGNQKSVVITQLSSALVDVTPEQIKASIVVAYEPVWAIGTGEVATPDQASEMHGAIRAWLGDSYGEAGSGRSILYGGSVKPANASDLIDAPNIDGFLIGGASLDAQSFLAIVRAAAQARQA